MALSRGPGSPRAASAEARGDLRKGTSGKQRAFADHGIGCVEKAMGLEAPAQEIHACMHRCLNLT